MSIAFACNSKECLVGFLDAVGVYGEGKGGRRGETGNEESERKRGRGGDHVARDAHCVAVVGQGIEVVRDDHWAGVDCGSVADIDEGDGAVLPDGAHPAAH